MDTANKPTTQKRSKRGLVIIMVIGVVLVLAGLAWFLVHEGEQEKVSPEYDDLNEEQQLATRASDAFGGEVRSVGDGRFTVYNGNADQEREFQTNEETEVRSMADMEKTLQVSDINTGDRVNVMYHPETDIAVEVWVSPAQ